VEPCARMRTGQPGEEYVLELLKTRHPARIHQVLRMTIDTFFPLCDWMLVNRKLRGRLIDIPYTTGGYGGFKPRSVEEKLMIFLYIIGFACS
jgi:hypothetical protein